MRKLVRIKKSILCFVLSFVIVGTSVAIPYQEAKAEAIVAGTVGVVGGVALLSLAAMCGVGMDLENNKRFNELSDDEKERIQNGLVTNFDDVALQRGAAIEDIHKWVTDLGNGVLDKASECWGIFKDWVKNISLSDNEWLQNNVNGQYVDSSVLIGKSFQLSNGNTLTISEWVTSQIKPGNCIGYIVCQYSDYIDIMAVIDNSNSIINKSNQIATWKYAGYLEYRGGDGHLADYMLNRIKVSMCSKPIIIDGVDYNGLGLSKDIFSTNTDYLERLKGENEDVIDVIDVTDAKNPIVESRTNNLTRIDYNRGGKRPTPDDDDDDKVIMGGLVPTNIYYDALDDYNEGLKNEVVIYDNKINENPDNQGKVFVSPAPIVNVNNFFNTLPCVNVPAANTVVNNNYTYNNYNNNNTTIYELPYNSELIPYLPTMLFENKFPFCIPFDIYTLFSVFYVEREAPEFTFDVPFPSEKGLQVKQITLGLKDYEYCALVLRIMWYFLFLLGLMLISRKLIKG